MDFYSTLASICTALSFLLFIGIVAWAYSSRRRQPFEAAAQEPFVLPDDFVDAARTENAGVSP